MKRRVLIKNCSLESERLGGGQICMVLETKAHEECVAAVKDSVAAVRCAIKQAAQLVMQQSAEDKAVESQRLSAWNSLLQCLHD